MSARQPVFPGKAGPSSDFLSMATSHSYAGPYATWSPPHAGARAVPSQLPGLLLPTLLRGLRLLVAPPRAPGCQVLVPLLKGLEQGGGRKGYSVPSRSGAVCAQLLLSLEEIRGLSLCPRQASGQPCPGPNAKAQNRSDLGSGKLCSADTGRDAWTIPCTGRVSQLCHWPNLLPV